MTASIGVWSQTESQRVDQRVEVVAIMAARWWYTIQATTSFAYAAININREKRFQREK